MGKKQKAKAIKKTTAKKVAVKPAAKKAVKKPAAKKVVAKNIKAKPAPAPKKVKKVITKSVTAAKKAAVAAKPVPANKLIKPIKNTTIQKPQAKVVAKPATVSKAKQVMKPATAAPIPEKKIVKKIIVPAKKREIHPNQYTIEYPIHASASLLFEIISSPSGLSEWFADNVNIRDGNFTFFWDGSQQTAKMVAYKEEKMVRFRWTDKPDYTFFEFKIETDELTNDTSLIITDFAEDGDKESAKLLWDNQINGLKHAIGS